MRRHQVTIQFATFANFSPRAKLNALLRKPMVLAFFLAAASASPANANANDQVVIALPQLVQNFDPIKRISTAAQMAYDFLYDGLLNAGPDGKYPALAESWEITPDG